MDQHATPTEAPSLGAGESVLSRAKALVLLGIIGLGGVLTPAWMGLLAWEMWSLVI